LIDPAGLPRRVLCLAPHPDDEVLGCGGALALHAGRGDCLRVVVLTDGAPRGGAELAAAREAESRAAGQALGVADYRFLAYRDGRLGAAWELVEKLTELIEEFDPELVYGPSPFEHHADHRAASRALLAALAGGRGRRVFLYGVNERVPGGVLLDTTGVWHVKERALACFTSQGADILEKCRAVDRARTVNVDLPEVQMAEGFADLGSEHVLEYERRAGRLMEWSRAPGGGGRGEVAAGALELPAATAVISTWNRVQEVCANLAALRAQTLPFADIVVVDNASTDGTAEAIVERFPEVRLLRMADSSKGACETFNIGFAACETPLLAILDDDVLLPPEWLEKTTLRMLAEPDSTAVVSTKIVEPEMPAAYRESEEVNRERYMSTFRGCASLAKGAALREAGFYDERLFIYGNERDLTCRLLNLGYRVLQYPGVETFHRQPFGVQMGKRSLFYHARNAWLTQLKYAPLGALLRLPWLVLTRVILRSSQREAGGEVNDATGTIGIGRALREVRGSSWVLVRAGLSVIWHLPYCLRQRQAVRSGDFELPIG
jgi:LmbE family N-acetylglucosaminyl deacetylase/GT2 family glycosyltransferase